MFERFKKHKTLPFVVVSCVSVVFLVFIVGAAITMPGYGIDADEGISFEDSWTDMDGDDADPSSGFRGEHSFSSHITHEETMSRSLCFVAKNVEFDVLIDGQKVYSFHPHGANILGKFYGSYPHAIELVEVKEDSVITIQADTINGSKGKFTGVVLRDGSDFIIDIFKQSIFPYCASAIISIMGLALVVGGFSILKNSRRGKEITAMGLFALCAGIWTACSTSMSGIITGNPLAVHFVDYMSLILLPGFTVLFVFILTGRKKRFFANVFLIENWATLLIEIILTAAGVATYHALLPVTHIECFLAVGYSFYCVFKTLMGGAVQRSTRNTMLFAFLAVTSGGIVDLIRYIAGNSWIDTAYFFRWGLMVFIVIMGMNEVNMLIFYRKYETEAEQMGELAFTDSLTGLKNRTAFADHEKLVQKKVGGECIVVQFDINDLKKVNDNYGHEEGDKHIKAAADIINRSFGELGNCYRTGGDEFIVIIENLRDVAEFDRTQEKFAALIDAYNRQENPRIKLEIPYGFERFEMSSADVGKALRRADGKMYLMKQQMKGT